MSEEPRNQRPLQQWSKREQLAMALVCFAVGGLMLAGKSANGFFQPYLGAYGPYILAAACFAGIIWIHANAPRS